MCRQGLPHNDSNACNAKADFMAAVRYDQFLSCFVCCPFVVEIDFDGMSRYAFKDL